MKRLRVVAPFLGILMSCSGGSIEDACRDACDRAAECYSGPGILNVIGCHSVCAENERLFDSYLDNAMTTMRCYDAVRDSYACAADVSCPDVVYEDLQAACSKAVEEIDRACGG